ncbi:MAG: head-tail connector protein [Pseudomonadota bacterium]
MYPRFVDQDISVLTPPAAEPVTVAEAKVHSRIDGSHEDTLIAALIRAAAEAIEHRTRHRLMRQTVRLTMRRFPRRIQLPVWPVVSVQQIAWDDINRAEQVLDPSRYILIEDQRPREIAPAYGLTWPTPIADYNSVRVDLVVGHATAPAGVPADLRAALLMMFAHLYEHREAVITGTIVATVPLGVDALCAPTALHV